MPVEHPDAGAENLPPAAAGAAAAPTPGPPLGYALAWAVLAMSLSATVGGWLLARKHARVETERRFDEEVRGVSTALQERMAIYENMLHGGVGLFAASVSVERAEWRSYVERVSIEKRFPGVDAVGFIAHVPRPRLGEFLEATRRDGAPDFNIQSGGDPADLLVVKYLEPEEKHRALLGLDIGTNAERRAVAEWARDCGCASLSGRLSLDGDGAQRQGGLLMLLAVYGRGQAPRTLEERRAQIEGWVYARFILSQLMAEILGKAASRFDFELFEGLAPRPEQLLFTNRDAAPGGAPSGRWEHEPAFSLSETKAVAGRIWLLRFGSRPAFEATVSHTLSWLAGAGGALVSGLLFAIVWSLSTTRVRALALAREVEDRTRAEAALRLDEQRLGALARLNEMTEAPLKEITDFALEEAVRLTRSRIGYLAFLNEDESVLTMHSWSQTAMAECAILDKPIVYPVASTGLWGEAVRQRRPVITNDYAAPSPLKKGHPFGHVTVRRHMNVPVFEGPRIVAVAGVGNKHEPYEESDVVQLRLLMTGMWRLLQRNRAREELLALNATLEQRVAERTAAAESANRAKSQFLANMSHELRTPLNSVIGFANILLKNKAGNLRPEDLTFLDRILANGKHLLGLINQILDLAKVEARKVEVVKTSVALDRLVPDLLGQFEAQVRGKPLKLQADLPRPMARLETDEGKLRQVLINLVGNAIKFTDRGSVTVRVAVDEATRQPVRIEVADTGIGIPPDRQAAVFEAFQQADASTTRRYGGTGLGLTICKALCELLGYRLELRSGVGQGSTFSLFLPAPVVPVPAGPPSPAEVPAPVPTPPVPAPPSAPTAREKLVLVIDDEADSRLLLTRLVEECGCRVVAVDSGDLALKMARELRPDLITLDLLMPRLDGWGVLKHLKDEPELRQIPVVVVSVVAAEHRGTVLGAVEVLPKPVAREDLLRVLQTRPRARLLLVEDNADDRRLVSAHLADRGVELRTAANGRLALEELKRFSPDVILLDLMMPEMDGLTFLDALRQDPRHWQVPVYVVTAKELTVEEQQRLARQTQAVLKKAEDWGGDLERLLNGLLKSPPAPARAMAPAVDAQPAAKP